MNKFLRKNNGVTLLALMITVIIIIILSTISLNSIKGKKGIISETKDSQETAEITRTKQELLVELAEQRTVNPSNAEIDEYLNHLEEKEIKTTEKDGKYYIEKDGKIFEMIVNNNNKISSLEYKREGTLTAPRIKNIQIIEKNESSISIETTAVRMEGGTYFYYIGTSENNFGNYVSSNSTRKLHI